MLKSTNEMLFGVTTKYQIWQRLYFLDNGYSILQKLIDWINNGLRGPNIRQF